MAKTTPPLLQRKQCQPTLTSLHLPFHLVEQEILCKLPEIPTSPTTTSACQPPAMTASSAHITMSIYSLRESLNKRISYANRASTCDGIMCFKIDNSSALLCNPFIRKFKILPPLSFSDQGYFETLYTLYTLVYDRFTNKYKIIAVYTRKKEVHVHTLGTDYWRRIQDYPGPHLIGRARSGTFVNDFVNWLTHESDSCAQYIVSLDLEKESYQKLSLPVFDVHFTTSCVTTLGTLRGCLSLFCYRDMFCDV
ncbi:F-box/kelch-repeat protein At3g23880-like [Vicia villosa]|uniref:F-box/kelch-repeat protein At3g23880-like n=1 Tax=Vicia villosa TaxID=3911 RepID=UPI00273C54AF|nr:F-box/kelch-repeat protein At3g23880-like [Vicia villosa]